MGRWRWGRGRWWTVAGLICTVGLRSGAAQTNVPEQKSVTPTQTTGTGTLGEILQRLQENVEQYQAQVPSFFCDEHVVSTMIPDPGHESRVTDATFRLKRALDPAVAGRMVLEESHEVKLVNGEAAAGELVGGPAFLRGAFSNGLAMVSASQQACMRYTLKSMAKNKPGDLITIQFASVSARVRASTCGMQEDVSGHVLIDPEMMQVTHLEFTAPRHIIGTATNPTHYGVGTESNWIMGRWDVMVEYAPILLDGKSFWLPTKISDRMRSDLVVNRWSYDATYSNYHKLEVKSRILPGVGTSGP